MDIKKIIFDSPLYTKWDNDVELKDDNGLISEYELDYLISSYSDRVEHYCTECKARRVFAPDLGVYDARNVRSEHFGRKTIENKPSLFKTFRCSANNQHQILFSFHLDNDILIKISEYPSKYDTVIDNFSKYKKIFKNEQLKELAKASQLESYGYAIASFLYYRRIFEGIILKNFNEADIADKISEEEFRKKRMEDKLKYVKDTLPDYFNENSHIYSTLSKGVHELKES